MNPKRCHLEVEHYPHDWDFYLVEDENGNQSWIYSVCDGLVWL